MGDCYLYPNVDLFGKTSCLCSQRACPSGVLGNPHGSPEGEQLLSPSLSRYEDRTRDADAAFPHNQNLKPQVFLKLSFVPAVLPFLVGGDSNSEVGAP